jgi:transposase
MTAAHAVKRTLPEVTRPAPTRPFAWLSKCRGILVRYEKKDGNYLGLIQLACGLLWYRRLHRMGRCDATQNTT